MINLFYLLANQKPTRKTCLQQKPTIGLCESKPGVWGAMVLRDMCSFLLVDMPGLYECRYIFYSQTFHSWMYSSIIS